MVRCWYGTSGSAFFYRTSRSLPRTAPKGTEMNRSDNQPTRADTEPNRVKLLRGPLIVDKGRNMGRFKSTAQFCAL